LLFVFGTTFEVANMGTMYRMRFQTWVFCFVLAAWGLESLLAKLKTRVNPFAQDLYQT